MNARMLAGTISLATACAGLAIAAPASTTMYNPATAVAVDEDLETSRGTIKSVNIEESSFVLTSAGGEDMTIRITRETKYTLDGKDSTKEEALKAGAKATVKHERNVAQSVDVLSSSNE